MDAATIEKVAEKVGKLDRADHILAWDKKQAGWPHDSERPRADGDPAIEPPRLCKTNKDHGRLQMHGSGDMLICCAHRQGCEYREPVSR